MDHNSTSVLFESNSPYFDSNKAVFTVLFSSTQILVVNSVACQMLNYSSEELCSMTLENIINDSCKNKWLNLKLNFFKNSTYISCSNEKLVELVTRKSDILVVSLYLKKLDSFEKCLVIAQPIIRRGGLISTDIEGKILSYEEEVAIIFQYGASEMLGTNIQYLLPAINLQGAPKCVSKQYITGRTKNMDVVPVCLIVNMCSSNTEMYQIQIWTFPSINGFLVVSEDLALKNCTNYLVKVLLGYSKKNVLNKSVMNLIPNFCKDVKVEMDSKQQCANDDSSFTDELYCSSRKYLKSLKDTEGKHTRQADHKTHFKTSCKSSSQLRDTHCVTAEEGNLKIDTEKEPWKTNLFSENTLENQSQTPDPDHTESYNEGEKEGRMDFTIFSDYFPASGVKYVGFAKHNDNTFIVINYQVKKVVLSNEMYFCVWVSSELPIVTEMSLESNMSRSSSIYSTSTDSFCTRDSAFGESSIRQGNFSLISECDEVLTTGEYSQHYTNIMEIGKGGFGYVKMAFRNSDGLLVVTKFIRKKKVNVSSWVSHLNQNIKIPLEISFLITLQHPNIVKVLDVFHNDFFVQLVMEKHGPGFDLFEFIDRGPNCDEKLKSYIFRQIASAVYYLDSLGILHRDIKDENIIINEKFDIKLIDFGSAAFMPQDECFSKFYGTVEYCSPEVLQGNSYRGPELEIWALGVTLYILTFGENPFYDVEDTIKGQFSIPSPISAELSALLNQMLDKNVETRITIEKLVENCWVNQPICIENYKFEEVVRCSENEARPPKYIHEMSSKECLLRTNMKSDLLSIGPSHFDISLQTRDTNAASDFDDKLFDNVKWRKFEVLQRKDKSPTLVSSTPLKKRNFRLCKSAIGMRKPVNTSLLNDLNDSCDSNSYADNTRWERSKLRQINKSSPNLLESATGEKKEFVVAWNETDSDLVARFEKCAFIESPYSSSKDVPEKYSSHTRSLNEIQCLSLGPDLGSTDSLQNLNSPLLNRKGCQGEINEVDKNFSFENDNN
ncbi:hypothetical protein RUM44_000980 [Polyplax serrata]|uniref:Protein kinase domain-containing protein n=1 Tax=Polyplax serrata TaxID=468196 RepID=A0ABR1B7G3_POLSC